MQTINIILVVLIIIIGLCLIYKQIEPFTDATIGFRDDTMQFIKKFTKGISTYRPVGSTELATVKNEIMKQMKEIGLKTEVQTFKRIINNKEYSFSNLIGINPNAYQRFILLGVHVDSPQIPGCQSAIDAATGISIALQLAKNIMLEDPTYPVMLLFIDGEEAIDGDWNSSNSLSGSNYFVNNYDLTLIDKVYIFDLIGGDLKENKIAQFKNNPATSSDLETLSRLNEKYEEQIFMNPADYVSDKDIQDDHVPFVEKQKYALNLIPYKFPKNHHTLNDTYENVNWKYVEIFYRVLFDFLKQIDYY